MCQLCVMILVCFKSSKFMQSKFIYAKHFILIKYLLYELILVSSVQHHEYSRISKNEKYSLLSERTKHVQRDCLYYLPGRISNQHSCSRSLNFTGNIS